MTHTDINLFVKRFDVQSLRKDLQDTYDKEGAILEVLSETFDSNSYPESVQRFSRFPRYIGRKKHSTGTSLIESRVLPLVSYEDEIYGLIHVLDETDTFLLLVKVEMDECTGRYKPLYGTERVVRAENCLRVNRMWIPGGYEPWIQLRQRGEI